ncbi:MAG: hypothetical protein R3B51_02760 [Thermodesulfobacteriota bacterium]
MLHKTPQNHPSYAPNTIKEEDYPAHAVIDIHGLVIECISKSPISSAKW